MATIGLSIESGALHAVLFDGVEDSVAASQVTALDDGVAASLTAAIESMRELAAAAEIAVDGIGVVYRSDEERALFESAIEEADVDSVSMISASSALLGWLARSTEFTSAERVLLYYMGPSGVSISLADAAQETLTPAKTAAFESPTPERIGGTVALAWEVLDESGEADSVALFGDLSGNRDVIDILSLGLGVPVIRVGDANLIAASGAGLLAERNVVRKEPSVLDEDSAADDAVDVVIPVTDAEDESETVPAVAPAAPVLVTSEPPVVAAEVYQPRVRRSMPRKKLVLAGAFLVGILSGGVALASTLPADSPKSQTPTEIAKSRSTAIDTDLGKSESVAAQPPALTPEPAPPPPAPWAPEAVFLPAPVVENWTVDPTTGVAKPRETFTPIPAQSIPPAAAVVPRSEVAPPEFAVPVIIPEPGKSQEQLEQEAWDRHWQHTAQWVEQEFHEN
ncbi:hypothetical protein O1W68_20880 [Rhodococcus sp. H36-A4]|uniref:hypothetical protein n=1 Tax=Rhodococcus sp. H36-A4 TaxID=3004353 RepID=UPI0022AE7891|nr:hypothetical protein [Rhodococcus sp. H36-A4]MCZ4080403.1 hypothetical protein [Rhodococcus sp. H36-A4]